MDTLSDAMFVLLCCQTMTGLGKPVAEHVSIKLSPLETLIDTGTNMINGETERTDHKGKEEMIRKYKKMVSIVIRCAYH